MADGLDAGTCFVNTYNKTDVAAPFGGFKQSGYGKDLGKANSKPFMLQTKSGLNLREVMLMIIVVISLVQDGHHLINNIYRYVYFFLMKLTFHQVLLIGLLLLCLLPWQWIRIFWSWK